MSRWLRPPVVGAPNSFKRDSFLTERQTSSLDGAAYGMHVLVASEQGREPERRNPVIPRYSGECGNKYQNARRNSHRRGRGVKDHRLNLKAQANNTPQRQFGPEYDR